MSRKKLKLKQQSNLPNEVNEYVTLKIFRHPKLPKDLQHIKNQLYDCGAIEDIWELNFNEFTQGGRDHFFLRVGIDDDFDKDVETLSWTDAIEVSDAIQYLIKKNHFK